MVIEPANVEDLCHAMASAHARHEKIAAVETKALHRILEHCPEDMTATVEAGIALGKLQSHLAQRGQWLPIDPPNPESLTIRELLASNRTGPRRLGYGTIRDYLVGIKVVMPDGSLIKAGGKVVKNVAGYDLGKLFIGGYDSLGIIVEATFKLQPIPEAEEFIKTDFDSLDRADAFIETVVAAELTPTVMDLHNVLSPGSSPAKAFAVVLGFAGPREDVDYQLEKAREFGTNTPADLDYDRMFWDEETSAQAQHISVLPSKVTQLIRELKPVTFVARAGNGAIWYRGGPISPKDVLPRHLMGREHLQKLDVNRCHEPTPSPLPGGEPATGAGDEAPLLGGVGVGRLMGRVKNAFDPNRILPDLPL